ncbi:DUF7507 domain-containing protein [Curtobacterium aurantiacum]|uniref:DUF7507 domain-containing protein n=1 Tax=Curtobacterium aurantiacum TaxID=3236919 RepID=UPI001BDFF7D7|nr:hypothetical protein [Curtobacterium flaccumfaciens]MBT1675116.1 hypothetical protein [Curtobacterium flaccumfaciens pv. flaccumfaciens]
MNRHHFRRRVGRGAAVVTAAGLLATLSAPLAATAVSGQTVLTPAPTTTTVGENDPRVLFVEDFEHGVGTTPIMLDQYIGVDGAEYTADPAWINAAECNGIITSHSSTAVSGCNANGELRALGSVLGQITGEDRETNHVVSAWTSSRTLPTNGVQIESLDEFSLGASGRYVSFGVSAAAGACVGYAHPLLDFLLVDGTVERPVSSRPIDPCTDPRSTSYTVDGATYQGGQFVSSGGILFSGETLRWRLRNAQSSANGNDGAFDHVTIVDSTPTLANEFTGAPIVGDTARMTIRVVNTSEHGSKPGWSFSEELPDGLRVAADPKTTTNCAASDLDVVADGGSVGASGNLALDAVDCSISFDVTASASGTYVIDADDVTERVGLDLPASASVTFAPEQNQLRVVDRAVLTGGNEDGVADLGESVAFHSTVENAGDVLVRELALTGTNGVVTCDTGQLEAGASTSCATEARPVSQADIDRGSIDDSLTAEATSRSGESVTATATATVPTTQVAPAATLELTPAVHGGAPGVGDDVGLTVTVTNAGNISLSGLAVTIANESGMTVDCPAVPLAPGASVECEVTGAHRVSQADVDRGAIPFTASMTAVGPADQPVRTDARTSQPTVAQAPALGTSVTADLDAAGAAPAPGDRIDLAVTVRNTGNVTLTDAASTFADREGLEVTCASDPVAVGSEVECTVSGYALTQADIDAGVVDFAVDSTATTPTGATVSAKDTASVTVDRRSGVVGTLTAGLRGTDAPKAGDPVSLDVHVRNSGNVTLRDLVAVIDGRELAVTCPDGALVPGAEVDCAVEDHELTQREIDAGKADFGLTATAEDPAGSTVRGSDAASVALARAGALSLSATSVLDPTEHEVPEAGDRVTVTVTLQNTGNVTLDDLAGKVSDRAGMTVTCPDESLAPGERVTCEVGSYTLTQADVDAGSVRFALQGTATDPDESPVEAAGETATTIVRAPSISSAGTASVDTEGRDHGTAGDAASLSVTVENTGNVTVSDLVGAVEDRTGMLVSCAPDALAPGETVTCNGGTTPVTQAEVDAGEVAFVVVSSATGSNGQGVVSTAEATAAIKRAPAVDVTVVAHLAASDHAVPHAGDHVNVAVRVANAGNVTLSDATAELVELADMPVTCPTADLAPGATIDCVVEDHVLSQSDVDHGVVPVAAVANAAGPDGTPVDDRDDVRVGLTAANVLDLSAEPLLHGAGDRVRVIGEDHVLRPGDRVSVRYQVVNTGNTTVTDPQHADGTSALDCSAAPLRPGERAVCDRAEVHVVTDADADATAGEVVFVGQVAGHAPRADGSSTEAPGAASTGQLAPVSTTRGAASAGSATAEPVWVFSERVRTTLTVEPAPVVPAAAGPLELAFTGSEILMVGVPSAIVLLLAGAVLMLRQRHRAASSDSVDDRQV